MQRQNHSLRLLPLLFCLASIASYPLSAFAARVVRSQGKAVEIELASGEDFVKGDKVIVTAGSKKVGIIKIAKIKGKKAVGRLTKGKAPDGSTVVLASAKGTEPAESGVEAGKSHLLIGFIGGYSMDNQTVKKGGTVTEDVAMTGSGFSAKGFADLAIADNLGLIARIGAESFKVAATAKTAICAGTLNCSTEIMYLSADLLVRYIFVPGSFNPYLAGGLGIYFPMSKKTTILDETQIASTTIFYGTLGANIKLGESLYLPIQVEYGLFPPSNQVSTNFITGRVGVAFPF